MKGYEQYLGHECRSEKMIVTGQYVMGGLHQYESPAMRLVPWWLKKIFVVVVGMVMVNVAAKMVKWE